ncbi:hypothetical protein PAAG_11639 [Paracoccidioides lutzii Pb01]|uniref:Uncharacterized protein n=1 Tax=Paracoccidioides lutzii (strain ATCC MYA-826 / Pb01) TaxID=502779 RepID=A0A0A2V2E7_PARBA|nr:hypothetical protein PAAG_11639 [Paracoccidioides lutzii Pb01]KGQ01648.1 hypothetical protein PAAG_11639 [Paracoccidioides lutzii Pb01]
MDCFLRIPRRNVIQPNVIIDYINPNYPNLGETSQPVAGDRSFGSAVQPLAGGSACCSNKTNTPNTPNIQPYSQIKPNERERHDIRYSKADATVSKPYPDVIPLHLQPGLQATLVHLF